MNMLPTGRIEIDLDVNRAIEARRTDFGQSRNAILRDVFGLPPSSPGAPPAKPPKQRRTGIYAFVLLGDRIEERNLKGAYISCLRKLAELDPDFLDRLSQRATRSRRIVATNPRDLYLNKPELADKFAERLVDPWWVDTNLSRLQCEHRLQMACDVAGLQFGGGGDLVLEFPGQ